MGLFADCFYEVLHVLLCMAGCAIDVFDILLVSLVHMQMNIDRCHHSTAPIQSVARPLLRLDIPHTPFPPGEETDISPSNT